jgi:hypothetical protein
LAENLKTFGSKDCIKCDSLDAVKSSINANHANFTDFDSVKDTYLEFKHTLGLTNDPKSIKLPLCGGSSHSHQSGQGQGHQTSNSHQKSLVPQAEIDKQTHIQLSVYSDKEYKKLTPAEKQKLWQLRNAGKTPRTGPTRHDHDRNISVAHQP